MYKGFAPDFAFKGNPFAISMTVGNTPAALLQFGNRGVEIVHFEGDMVDAGSTIFFEKFRHRAVIASGFEQFHPAFANIKWTVANTHIFNIFFRQEFGAEPVFKYCLCFVEIWDCQGNAFDSFYVGHTCSISFNFDSTEVPSGIPSFSRRMISSLAIKMAFSCGVATVIRTPFGIPNPAVWRMMTPRRSIAASNS